MSRVPVNVLVVAIATAAMTGCTSISGLSGESGYACKAPAGVACDSVSGTYANAVADRLPGRRGSASTAAPSLAAALPQRGAPMPGLRVTEQPNASASLRSTPRVLRLWVKPWEDADGDLIDQSYVYVRIDSGQWLIEHAQRQIREAFAPVKPPPRLLNASAEPDASTDSARPQPQRPSRPAVQGMGTASPSQPLPADPQD